MLIEQNLRRFSKHDVILRIPGYMDHVVDFRTFRSYAYGAVSCPSS